MNPELRKLQEDGTVGSVTMMPEKNDIKVRVTDRVGGIHTITYEQTSATPGGAPDDDSKGLAEWVSHSAPDYVERSDECVPTARAAALCVEDAGYTIEGERSPYLSGGTGGD